MVKLYYKTYGEGIPIIILHGLYGSSDNWAGIARKLQSQFKVYVVDVRNHGRSPHAKEHNYDVLADDLLDFMNDLNIYSANLIGHSMGGKIVLSFALFNPERVKSLLVVDISPRTYHINLGDRQFAEHTQILNAIKNLDVWALQNREQADEEFAKAISDSRVRAFLLKNLYRDKEKNFKWRLNVDALFDNLENVLLGFEDQFSDFKHLDCPVLFIKGEKSNYIQNGDMDLILSLFETVQIKVINDASHWVHAEKPQEFIEIVQEFCM